MTGFPHTSCATTIAPSLRSMSSMLVVIANTAMISLATVMSNPVSRVNPFSVSDCPIVIFLKNRSFMSTTRRHEMRSRSMSSRANFARSSVVSASASSLLCPNPSLSNRPRMLFANAPRFPSFPLGHRRSNSASSFCVSSWNTRCGVVPYER